MVLGINEKNKNLEFLKVYFFTNTYRFEYYEVTLNPEDNNKTFNHPKDTKENKTLYIVDRRASKFYTEDRKPIYFYIEGIPNPLIFNFTKYLEHFIKMKRENPEALVYDDDNNLLDISFASGELQYFKDNNFLKKLLSKINPEWMKLIYILVGLCALSWVGMIIIVLMVKK